jgi:hypothetical protein
MPTRQGRGVAEKRSARLRPASYSLDVEQNAMPAEKTRISYCLTVPTRRILQEALDFRFSLELYWAEFCPGDQHHTACARPS